MHEPRVFALFKHKRFFSNAPIWTSGRNPHPSLSFISKEREPLFPFSWQTMRLDWLKRVENSQTDAA
jgi:hypothetical protein